MPTVKNAVKVDPKELYGFLTGEKGLSHNHTIGMIANIRAESNFNYAAIGDGGTSGGLFQHHANRFENLKEFAGDEWQDWRKQVEYTLTEKDTKKYLGQKFESAEQASKWFTLNWERPANKEQKAEQRARYATEYHTQYYKPPTPIAPATPFFPTMPPPIYDNLHPNNYKPVTAVQVAEEVEKAQVIEKELASNADMQRIEAKKQFLIETGNQPEEAFIPYAYQAQQQEQEPQYETPFNLNPEDFDFTMQQMPQLFITNLNETQTFDLGGTFTEDNPRNVAIKAKLAYEYQRGNKAVLRMMSGTDQPYQFEDGNTGTHYMASMDNFAVPLIQDENGNLVLGDYGPESQEAIKFDSEEDAAYFAENYKHFAPAFQLANEQ